MGLCTSLIVAPAALEGEAHTAKIEHVLRIVESTDTYFIWEEEIHGHAKPLMAIVFFDGLMIS